MLRVILFNLKGRQYLELSTFDRIDDDCKRCRRSWPSPNLLHYHDSCLQWLRKIKRTSVRVNWNTVENRNGCFQNTSRNHRTGASFLGRIQIVDLLSLQRGERWRSWLTHCATSRKVAGSIPDGVIGIFHWHNPSGRTRALGSTQTLTEMSTRNISWG